MSTLQFIFAQVNHPIWYYNAFFYLFVALMILFFVVSLSMMKLFRKKTAELKLTQQQHIARIDIIRKDHSDTLEKLRIEMLKREEDRTRQWMESEKETLRVLNGVSSILELGEKMLNTETGKMQNLIIEIRDRTEKIEKLLESDNNNGNEQKNRETQGS
jgi:hypothetical protein